MIKAVLDACVLYSAPVRGFLLRLATAESFCPFWSEEIQNEWTRNLLQNRPDLKQDDLEQTRRRMDFHFPGSHVSGHDAIIPTLNLPDIKDRHVLAVAIQVKAKYIVTFNLSDFPELILQSHNIEAVSPDDFVMRLISQNRSRVLWTVRSHQSSLTRPPKTVDEYLAELEERGFIKTVALLRKYRNDI